MSKTIEERARRYFVREWKGSLKDAYVAGAESQEKITKKEMTEKACEWLKVNLWNYYVASSQADNCGIDDENLLYDFRKAMEEGV